jgi:SsrA-binding protein
VSRHTDGEVKQVATNRKALYEYFIEDRFEAGVALTGTEIKSVRAGRVNLRDGFVLIRNGEAWLVNVHIAPYDFGNRENHEPRRERRLLLHKQEIRKMLAKVSERGWTVVPLNMHLVKGRAKVEVALVRGKRQYDRKDAVAERDADRELRRQIKDQDWD